MATLIPTNQRTAIRIKVADDTQVQPWTIEFRPSNPDMVRLYSVDGDPHLILVETSELEGVFALSCYLGLHGETHAAAGTMEFEIRRDVPEQQGEIEFDVR